MQLNFNSDGKLRILMIADTQEGTKVNPDTLNLIEKSLEVSSPDFVVYSGDQIWGKTIFKGNISEVERVLRELTEPVTKRNIPFAICFGNHDRQVGISNEDQFEIYKKIEGFIGDSVEGIDGVGNQVLEVCDGDEVKYLIYLIDSHSNLSIGYDHVHENQIQWYKDTRDNYEKKYSHLIPSVVIQHIPVCEVFELLTKVKRTKRGSVRGFRTHDKEYFVLNKDKVNANGFMKESPADPQENHGEFAALKEKGEVKGLYFGHDHNNSFNGIIDGIDVGYTQGCGFNVYGPGLDRGTRIIDIFTDGHLETKDLRYRDIIGKKLKKPITFAFFQLCPTNLFDALVRITKACVIIAVVLIAILLYFFFTK